MRWFFNSNKKYFAKLQWKQFFRIYRSFDVDDTECLGRVIYKFIKHKRITGILDLNLKEMPQSRP